MIWLPQTSPLNAPSVHVYFRTFLAAATPADLTAALGWGDALTTAIRSVFLVSVFLGQDSCSLRTYWSRICLQCSGDAVRPLFNQKMILPVWIGPFGSAIPNAIRTRSRRKRMSIAIT